MTQHHPEQAPVQDAGSTDAQSAKAAPGMVSSSSRQAVLGALFLMATSAIGPGFITQTANFTVKLGAAFAFAILISILVDIAVQLNVWRVIGVSGAKAHELANSVLPGLGWFIAVLVSVGGLVFNIANTGGGGLGIQAMTGLDPLWGGLITAALAIAVFLSKKAGIALDKIVTVLGIVMLIVTAYVAVVSDPPVMDALKNTVAPEQVDFFVIITLIGGTVGGYITYAGAHRMVDSGITGPDNAKRISNASVFGIILTGVMRFLLFMAFLGVVAGGVHLSTADPAGEAFQAAAGQIGLRLYGIILWAASISSVIGAAYTSVSFLTSDSTSPRTRNLFTVLFIAISAIGYVALGQKPVTLLVAAGAINGLILPFGFAVVLIVAWFRRDLLHGYRYPKWLAIIGTVVWLLTIFMAYRSFATTITTLFG